MKKLLLLSLLMFLIGSANAQYTKEWVSVKDGNWQDPTTWGNAIGDPNGYPGAGGVVPVNEKVTVKHAVYFYDHVYFNAYIEVLPREAGEVCVASAEELVRSGLNSCDRLAGLYFLKQNNTIGRLTMSGINSSISFAEGTDTEAYSEDGTTQYAANQIQIADLQVNGKVINAIPLPLPFNIVITETYLECLKGLMDAGMTNAQLHDAVLSCIASIIQPMPVEMLSMEVSATGNEVAVNWVVAREINLSHYVVEWSADAEHFSTAGTVSARGTDSGNQHYSISHLASESGAIYYRLLSVDIDGTVEIKGLRVVQLGSAQFNAYTRDGRLYVNYNGPLASRLILMDASGRIVSSTQSLTNGVETKNLRAGVYLVQLTNNLEQKTQRVLIN